VSTIAYRPVGLRRDGAAGRCPRRVEAGAPWQPAGLSLETGARGQTDAGRESTFTEEIGFRASLLNVDVNCALLSPGAQGEVAREACGRSVCGPQGQYLAFIHAFTLVNGRLPAEADLMRFFWVTPQAFTRWSSVSRRSG
jgi:hypothetical protein